VDTATPAAAVKTQEAPHVGHTAMALSQSAHADNKEPRARDGNNTPLESVLSSIAAKEVRTALP
jgi:hypothetical protein